MELKISFPNYQPRATSSEKGFTLIEAIVATSVFAVAVTSIIGVYTAVQRLNQVSASLQAVQQNARFILEDLAKIVRNGAINYASYTGGRVPQPSTQTLNLLDRDGVQVRIQHSGTALEVTKGGSGPVLYSGGQVRVNYFRAFVWPDVNPFPGGEEQPTVTLFFILESNINIRDKLILPFQTTVVTRQYPE